MTTDEILALVDTERERQREKWNRPHTWGYGDCSSSPGSLGPFQGGYGHANAQKYSRLIKAAVLAEEAGEVVKAALDVDPQQFKTEVVQTLAVAWAILEGIPE